MKLHSIIIHSFKVYLSQFEIDQSSNLVSHISNFSLVEVNPMSFRLNCSPCTVILDGQVVLVHSDSEESRFTPVSSPTVSADPVLSSVLNTPSHNCDFMVYLRNKLDLFENTSSIGIELFCSLNTA